MEPSIHAISLLTLALAALLSVLLLKRRTPTSGRALLAATVALVGMAISCLTNVHLCHEGVPQKQWTILGPCLFLALLYVDNKAWRRTLAAGLFVGMLALSHHFTAIVHRPGWTGNTEWPGLATASLRKVRESARRCVEESPQAQIVLAEGWLRDSELGQQIVSRTFGEARPERRQFRPAWHSRLTGLYRYEEVAQDYWYPGGPLTLAKCQRIELRDRPAP